MTKAASLLPLAFSLLALSAPALSQQAAPKAARSAEPTPRAVGAPPPTAETPAPREETYVNEKGFKARLFQVQHREVGDLTQVLRALGSGFRGAAISGSREAQAISVRDFPENIATMEEALKRLDVPATAHPDVQLKLHVLLAGGPEGPAPPEDLKEVVAALRGTLAYKSYQVFGTFVQRVKDGTRGVSGSGVALYPESGPKGDEVQMDYQISSVNVEAAAQGPATVRLDRFEFSASSRGRAGVKTDLTLRDGEKVVVGTSMLRDRALIVVLQASLAK